jgi:hypothetical protein
VTVTLEMTEKIDQTVLYINRFDRIVYVCQSTFPQPRAIRSGRFFLFGGIMDLNDVWVLEYSPIQGCFHVDRIEDSILKNVSQAIGARDFTGYITIFAGTQVQCNAQGEAIRTSGVKLVGRE